MERSGRQCGVKRPLDTTADAAANTFVQKVKSKVSGLLSSSFVGKWFHEEAAGGSGQPPPAKRARLPHAEDSLFAIEGRQGLMPTAGLQPELRPLNSIDGADRSRPRRQQQQPQPPPEELLAINGDVHSESSDSSDARQMEEAAAAAVASTSRSADPKSVLSMSLPSNSPRSLFPNVSLPYRSSPPSLSSRQPSFNVSMFGTSSFVDKSLTTRRICNSPFYQGRTGYGGASASRTDRPITRPMLTPNRSSALQIKPEEDTTTTFRRAKGDASMSKTARRILDALEQFSSSPARDARSIPRQLDVFGGSSSSGNSGVETPRRRAGSKQLVVPLVPDLLKAKMGQRMRESTQQMRDLAARSSSVLNDEGYSLPSAAVDEADALHARKAKMRAKVSSSSRRDARSSNLEETVPEVHLPDIPLPITTLPKFDFKMPTNTGISGASSALQPPAVAAATPSVPVQTAAATSRPAPATLTTPTLSAQFSFGTSQPSAAVAASKLPTVPHVAAVAPSKPSVRQEVPLQPPLSAASPFAKLSPASSPKPATVMSPSFAIPPSSAASSSIAAAAQQRPAAPAPAAAAPSPAPSSAPPAAALATQLKSKSSSTCSNNNNNTFEFAAPIIISSRTKTVIALNNFKFSPPLDAKERRRRPTPEKPKKLDEAKAASPFGEQFRLKTAQWECDQCMVRNEAAASKCAACAAEKPGSNPPPRLNNVAAGNGPDSFWAKPSVPKWSCSVCLVDNEESSEKCVACTEPRPTPGLAEKKADFAAFRFKPTVPPAVEAKKGDEKAVEDVKVKNNGIEQKAAAFGDAFKKPGLGDAFKKPAGCWDCPTCMVPNKDDCLKCACCETPKPGSQPAPAAPAAPAIPIAAEQPSAKAASPLTTTKNSNVWECPTCMVSNPKDRVACVCCETARPGAEPASVVAAASAPASAPAFSFGVPTEKRETSLVNKLEVDATPKKAADFVFGIKPSEKKPEEEAQPEAKFSFVAPTTAATTSSFSFGASKSPSGIFSFGASANTSIFGSKPQESVFGSGANKSQEIVFGSSISTKPQEVIFGSSNSSAKPQEVAFGSSSSIKPQEVMFGSSSTAPQEVVFGSSGGSAKPQEVVFGSSTKRQDVVFGSAAKTHEVIFGNNSKPSENLFGDGAAKPGGGFMFTKEPVKPPVFTFGSEAAKEPAMAAATTPAAAAAPAFGAGFEFKPVFGQAFNHQNGETAEKPLPVFKFGASSTAAPAPAAPASTSQSAGFSFKPAMTFSSSSPAPFVFGSSSKPAIPSFNAEAKPVFNFTGSAQPAFSAGELSSPYSVLGQRRIKKAVRRIKPR